MNNNQVKLRKLIIRAIVILTVILLIFLIALNYINKTEEEKNEAIMSGQFLSIKDLLEYYGCELEKTKDSTKEGFEIDIYAVLKYDLYTDEKSNEEFYNKLIEEIAKFLYYKNFRLIDESKTEKIEIEVYCKDMKIQKIIINGIEDYFIYMDSQISLKKYTEIPTTNFSIDAIQLIDCIQNNWSTQTDFGTREAIFQNYYIYFDEGIKTRKIDGKIYNVVFTEKYTGSIVNGLTVGVDNRTIKAKLGEPAFENGQIIGYKGDNIYVFFEKNQISVYRNIEEKGFDKFCELVDTFLADECTFLEFMNELTYIWPDYEEYTYTAESVFLSYPNKGIDIKNNYDNTYGIVLYNNIGHRQEMTDQYLEHTEFVAKLQVDNIFNAEQRRYEKENEFSKKCEEYKSKYETEDNRNRGQIYDYYMKMSDDNISACYFISQTPEFMNCELNESIYTYIWINDYCFVYSVRNQGIYFYDLKNQIKGTIISGDKNCDYKIQKYENGILSYDEENISVQY